MIKHRILAASLQKMIVSISLLLIQFISFAQEKKLEISVGVKKDNWYEQPWVWVVGAAVFILLLIAILRSGKKN